MYRLALVLTLLAACATKSAPSTQPSPEVEPAYQEPGPTPTSEEPPAAEPTSSVDASCYEECMSYMDDAAGCTTDCTSVDTDDSAADCFDECMSYLDDEDACSTDCY